MCQHLFNLFRCFLAQDDSILNLIKASHGDIFVEEGRLVFSLHALHELFNQTCKEKISYQDFQRQLYQSTLNQDLKAYDAQVMVHHSTGKVETSLYRLERLEASDSSA
ncbi:MAG: hypothetical protein R3E62_01655 [Pseudomonadales bacterium]|jgi:hypothetical protein